MWNTSSKKTDWPLRIGITGGIGSGKSLVCSIFRILGVPVFEADQVAKDLYNTDIEIKHQLIGLFGEHLYTGEGTLDRSMLASVIFNDQSALLKVNDMIHPRVRDAFEKWCRRQSSVYVLLEAAILFESGFYKMMDANILVTCPEELRIQRVMERDHTDREKVIARIRNQWPEENLIKLADFIIRNDEKDLLMGQILETDKKIRRDGKFC